MQKRDIRLNLVSGQAGNLLLPAATRLPSGFLRSIAGLKHLRRTDGRLKWESCFGCLGMWSRRTLWRAVCAAVILLIAFSRMYLGVHTPLDVGVAFAMGLALTLALLPLFRDIEEHPRRMYGLIGGMIAICAAYLLYVELCPFPADVDAANLASARENGYKLLGAASGMLLSFWLDRKYIHFDVKAPLAGQILKCVPGLAVVLAIKSGLKAPLIALLGTGGAADAARYFLVVLFAAGVWPMTFRFFASVGRKKERS